MKQLKCLMIVFLVLMGTTFILSRGVCQPVHVEIAEVKDNRKAIVTVISDDGVYETGVILNELAQKHNLRLTVAGYVRLVRNSIDEWKDIVEQGYVELVSHSWNHLEMSEDKNITDEQYYLDIYGARVFYEENFNHSQIGFVCPNNVMTERGYEFLKAAGYYAVRRGIRGENPLRPEETEDEFGWYNLGIRGIGDVKSTSERNAWVDSSINNNTWLIEMWHNVSPDGGTGYQEITTQMADEHLAYLAWQEKIGNIWVATYQEAVRYLREKQYAHIEAVMEDEEIVITLTCDQSKLPMELFNAPLTLLVDIPDTWDYVFAFQNGRSISVETDEATGKLMINALPDGSDIVLCTVL